MGIFQSKNNGGGDNSSGLTAEDVEKIVAQKLKETCDNHRNNMKINEPGKDKEEINEEFENLRRKHEALIERQGKDLHIPKSVISDKCIDGFVQKLIDDPNTNIYGFPDSMEKALYNKLLKTILHAVAHISDESAILLFGHQIRILIQPLDKEKEEKD